MKHSYPTLEPLRFLLQMIDNRTMALPDFQRDFVWDPAATDELIESIICSYPAGTLLRIKNGTHLLFKPRAFAGAPALNGVPPAYLILDGQQRLTSLYQAFYGKGEHSYYLNLAGLETGKDLEDCAFYLRAQEGRQKYDTLEQQAETLIFPMAKLFGATGGFSAWQNQVLRIRGKNATTEAIFDLQERLAALYERWVKPVEDYEFPMVTLSEEMEGAAVCMIFETLNRTGVKLSVFDLLTARFWPDDFNLREKWEAARSYYPILREYGIDPYYILQVIGLLEPGKDKEGHVRAPSIKRGAMLAMKVEQARAGWEPAIEGLANALEILRDDCGVLEPGLLPYYTILVPMGAIWARQKAVNGATAGANRLKIIRWFWCAVFGQKYENAPNSQAEKDFTELQRWMEGDEPPDSVSALRLDDLDLRQVTPRQRAVYRGVMALILQQGALDFYKRGKITAQLLADRSNPVDDHHIFPYAYLGAQSQSVPTALRDCILNRTFIDSVTNRSIGRRAPSDYFSEIRAAHGDAATDALLRSHVLPSGVKSPLLRNDFDKFLAWREKELKKIIQRITS